jgi:hypothetical protein
VDASVPARFIVEGMMTDERRDYAVLISLATREEAEVAAAALRADGIDAFIGNSNHAYTDWFTVLALNGLQILVPSSKLPAARQMLRERLIENAQVEFDEPVERRDRYKVWLTLAWLVSGFAAVGGNPLQEAALRETYLMLQTRMSIADIDRVYEHACTQFFGAEADCTLMPAE